MTPDADMILGPLITEKGTLVHEEANQVVFRVRPWANKVQIQSAVERLFKVHVEKVRTANYMGKLRRVGRNIGRRPGWKKAYVTLRAGDRIDFFEAV
jgi:large subunit ribosomal protein L23